MNVNAAMSMFLLQWQSVPPVIFNQMFLSMHLLALKCIPNQLVTYAYL